MAAPGFRKAGDQRLGLGGEEEHLDVVPFVFKDLDVGRQAAQRIGTAQVDRHGEGFFALVDAGSHELSQ
jgi:hypothetical protein